MAKISISRALVAIVAAVLRVIAQPRPDGGHQSRLDRRAAEGARRRRRLVSAARSLAVIVSGAMLLIFALAYAADVDPGWGGLWDDDGDNIILVLTANIVSGEPPTIADVDHRLLLLSAAWISRAPRLTVKLRDVARTQGAASAMIPMTAITTSNCVML